MLIERSMRLITSAHKGCQIDHGPRGELEERAVAHWRHQRPGEAPVEGHPQHWLEGQNLLPLVSAAPPGWWLHQVAQTPPPQPLPRNVPLVYCSSRFLLHFAECVSTRALGWWWTRASSSTPQWGEEGSGSFVSRRRTSSGPTYATAAMVRHASTHRHTTLASGPLSGL